MFDNQELFYFAIFLRENPGSLERSSVLPFSPMRRDRFVKLKKKLDLCHMIHTVLLELIEVDVICVGFLLLLSGRNIISYTIFLVKKSKNEQALQLMTRLHAFLYV
ncbi:hypothetical protein BpHYR1_006281 [Brachionus plicatilis]|uniref:Uncharacterized protein n=1 Tax=Brachionus plicatilis TaxID=10195 RepID=A0A3M7Q3I7_BRAPC|nr:hypothetical protein BpHYR1_006281 [Brachionus plicatilis]